MAKAKVARKSTWVDMTPFVDVAFLLLTFFMLATKFKPAEVIQIDTPTSTAQIAIPDNTIQISVDKEGRVFLGFDGPKTRKKTLDGIASKYKLSFTAAEYASFEGLDQFGVPITQLKDFLDKTPDQQKQLVVKTVTGIPVDTGVAAKTRDFYDWVREARLANPKAVIAIKGDRSAKIPVFNKIIRVLQDQDANRFNLITGMVSGPQQ